MQVGMIGLGKMGLNLAENMLDNGIEILGYDLDTLVQNNAHKKGLKVVTDINKMVEDLTRPRIVWVMLPAGNITNLMLRDISNLLNEEDIVIDGGNSFYQDTLDNNKLFSKKRIHFFDVGTSGGMSGARKNGNFMIGGDDEQSFYSIEPIFRKISAKNGYLYTGPSGSGHYLKMIHNGIEYGMMESLAEGFDVLEHGQFDYNNEAVARVWANGSVIRGWLVELAQLAFSKDNNLSNIKGIMHSSGEGKWTVDEAIKHQVPVPVIGMSLMMRYRSVENDTFTGKVVAALRNEFGGHLVDKK